MTEREEREYEKLKTVDDHLVLIKQLDDASCSMANPAIIDKAMDIVSKSLYRKTKYIYTISRPYNRRQGLFLRLRDKRIERAERKEREAEERAEKAYNEMKAKLAQEQLEQIKRDREEQRLGQGDNLSSLAPPKAEQSHVECEIVDEEDKAIEDGVSEENNSVDEDDGVMKF